MPERTRAMISSGSKVFAERNYLEVELKKAFNDVTVAPERSVAGTRAESYLEDARRASFMVVLLNQEPRKAVEAEIKAALDAGVHIAGFTLHYPPHLEPGDAWQSTPEEKLLREKGLFVREVKTLHELAEQMWLAIGHYISLESSRVTLTTKQQSYNHFLSWLNGHPRRIAMVQTTSMILLGARRTNPDEVKCLDLLRSLAVGKNKPQILHVFDRELTLRAATNDSDEYIRNGAVKTLLVKAAGAKPTVQLCASTALVSSALVVDDNVALATPLGTGGVAMSVIHDSKIADATFEMIKRNPFLMDKDYVQSIERLFGRMPAAS
jgi:hypothetical protein